MGTSSRSTLDTAKTLLIITVGIGAAPSACTPVGNIAGVPIVDAFMPAGLSRGQYPLQGMPAAV